MAARCKPRLSDSEQKYPIDANADSVFLNLLHKTLLLSLYEAGYLNLQQFTYTEEKLKQLETKEKRNDTTWRSE